MSEIKIKTYDDWLEVGRFVKKGEKAIGKNDKGKAMFSISQTDSMRIKNECSSDDIYDDDFHPPTAFDIGADF